MRHSAIHRITSCATRAHAQPHSTHPTPHRAQTTHNTQTHRYFRMSGFLMPLDVSWKKAKTLRQKGTCRPRDEYHLDSSVRDWSMVNDPTFTFDLWGHAARARKTHSTSGELCGQTCYPTKPKNGFRRLVIEYGTSGPQTCQVSHSGPMCKDYAYLIRRKLKSPIQNRQCLLSLPMSFFRAGARRREAQLLRVLQLKSWA